MAPQQKVSVYVDPYGPRTADNEIPECRVVEVPALEQVLRGRLLTGTHDHLLHGETAADEPALWAPAKVSGEYLSPYLIAKHVVHLPVRSAPAAAGIDVRIPLARERQRTAARC